MKTEISELKAKANVHEKIETDLKEKIKQLQEEYYSACRDSASQKRNEEDFASKVEQLEYHLSDIEKELEFKDSEVNQLV